MSGDTQQCLVSDKLSQALQGVGVFLWCLGWFSVPGGVRLVSFRAHFWPKWQTLPKEKTIPKGETPESVWDVKMLPFKREAWGFDNGIFETGSFFTSHTDHKLN